MTSTEFRRSAIDASACIGGAWGLVTKNLGLYIGMGLVTMLLIGCIPVISWILMGPMVGGFAYVVLRDMRGEPVDFGMLFKGFEKFVPLMVVGVIQAIPGIIFQMLQWTVDLGRLVSGRMDPDVNFYQSGLSPMALVIPVIIIGIGVLAVVLIWQAALLFAIPLIVEHDVNVVDAIKISIGAVFGNIGGIILLMILGCFVALVGVLALCVGIFVAIPVIWAANVFAYRQVFPLIEQNFNMSPPPPTAYGNFGSGMT